MPRVDSRVQGSAGRAQISLGWPVVAGFAVLAGLVVIWHLTAIPMDNQLYGLFQNYTDLKVYRAGGRTVLDGIPLYAQPVLWKLDFTYPPMAAIVFSPLAALSMTNAALTWWIATFLALVAIIVLSFRSLGYRVDVRMYWAAIFLAVAVTALEPVRTTIWLGQINIFLVLLVIADLVRRRPGAAGRWRGIGTGLAAGLKLTPGFFLIYLAASRQWRACATAAATLAATVAVGFAVIPHDAWSYWTQDVGGAQRVGRVDSPANQSVHGFLSQLMAYFDVRRYLVHQEVGPPAFDAPRWLWISAAVIVAALALWAAVGAYRTGRELLAVTIVGMTSCAVSPFAWGHHWVWFVPLLILALDAAYRGWLARRRRWWRYLALPIGLVALSFTYVYNWFGSGRHLTSDHAIALGLFMMPRYPASSWWNVPPALLYAGCYLLVLAVTVVLTLTSVHQSDLRWIAIRIRARKFRYVVHSNPKLHLAYRICVGVVGVAVLLVGFVTIPYPGPGWLIVFLGLAILASEFAWAHRVLQFARGKYDAWLDWIKRQPLWVQGLFGLATCAIVLLTLWLFGMWSMVGGWFGIDATWLASPIFD
ncbi:TIGR02611 family protein [Gordonia effusa]|uniref:TIGR02611 family protein n=1 Tax=Gordonia effusa TaxID=263908 RepID=UPI001478F3DE|nr:TIGR02611 family protein [Gordonia effusa]